MKRLAMRLLFANRWRNLALGATITAAVFGTLLLESFSRAIVDQLDNDAQQRYGAAQITLPGSVAGRLAGGGGWITEAQITRISEILQSESVQVLPGLQADAVVSSKDHFEVVRLISTVGGPIAGIVSHSEATADRTASSARSLLIGYTSATVGENTASGFMDLGVSGVPWILDEEVRNLVWIDYEGLMSVLRQVGLAPDDAVGNILRIEPLADGIFGRDRSPAVVAYDSAEILVAEFPQVVVSSRQDLSGRGADISAENVTLLLVLALVLPASAGIVGSVLITAESRSDELVLLRTMGFDIPAVRALIVREIFVVGVGATLLALALALVAAALAPNLAITGRSLVRLAFIGVLVPPGLSFLTGRSLLAGKIHQRLAELRR